MTLLPRGIDFHCHLDLYPDFERLVRECESEQIETLAVTTTPRAFSRNRELTQSLRFVRAALGLHPQLVAERANEISLFEQYLPQARFVGEVGLDAGPKHYGSFPLQRQVFSRVLQLCATAGNKVLSVHSTRAAKHVLQLIEELLPPDKGSVILHWFTGAIKEAEWAVQLGCYFSINGQMLQNPVHQKTIRSIPVSRLLTETDGPFVTTNGVPIRPRDVLATSDSLAALLDLSGEEMLYQLQSNVSRLLSVS